MMVGGIVLAVAVICDCLVWALVAGLELGRQAAWRPMCKLEWCRQDGWWHRAQLL